MLYSMTMRLRTFSEAQKSLALSLITVILFIQVGWSSVQRALNADAQRTTAAPRVRLAAFEGTVRIKPPRAEAVIIDELDTPYEVRRGSRLSIATAGFAKLDLGYGTLLYADDITDVAFQSVAQSWVDLELDFGRMLLHNNNDERQIQIALPHGTLLASDGTATVGVHYNIIDKQLSVDCFIGSCWLTHGVRAPVPLLPGERVIIQSAQLDPVRSRALNIDEYATIGADTILPLYGQ